MLGKRGYDTACIGKWHLGWNWATKDGKSINEQRDQGVYDRDARGSFSDNIDFSQPVGSGPTTRGFGYYFGDDVPNFPPYCFIENDRLLGTPSVPKHDGMFGLPGPMVEGWDLTAVMPALTQKAVDYIRAKPGAAPFGRREDAPFFLYFPLTAPHTPIAPTEAFQGKSQAGHYGDFVHEVDYTVGEVLRALEETGQAANTLVVFTSDNGSPARDGEDMAGEVRSVLRYGHNPSHIYRGIKADIWEGGHRVPFLVRWPGRVPAGTTSDELACVLDLMATCSAVAGVTLPQDAALDSYDLLPTFEERAGAAPIREALVHHSIEGMFAIRQGKWKLILGRGSGGWTQGGDDPTVPGQLYDLQNDPAEQFNRYTEEPEVVAKLEALLKRYQAEGRSITR
jgi:arylsulfatase A-like enzyme